MGIDLSLNRPPVITGNLPGFRLTMTCNWNLTMEISRRVNSAIEAFRSLGSMCQEFQRCNPPAGIPLDLIQEGRYDRRIRNHEDGSLVPCITLTRLGRNPPRRRRRSGCSCLYGLTARLRYVLARQTTKSSRSAQKQGFDSHPARYCDLLQRRDPLANRSTASAPAAELRNPMAAIGGPCRQQQR